MAEELMLLNCATNSKGEHFLKPEWSVNDIAKAVATCREKFGFPPKEETIND